MRLLKNFRTLDQAKKDLQVFQRYIHLVQTYSPISLAEHTVYQYALLGNIHHTADALNKLGFRLDGLFLAGKDVTKIILSKPMEKDYLHKEILRLYLKKTVHRKRYR